MTTPTKSHLFTKSFFLTIPCTTEPCSIKHDCKIPGLISWLTDLLIIVAIFFLHNLTLTELLVGWPSAVECANRKQHVTSVVDIFALPASASTSGTDNTPLSLPFPSLIPDVLWRHARTGRTYMDLGPHSVFRAPATPGQDIEHWSRIRLQWYQCLVQKWSIENQIKLRNVRVPATRWIFLEHYSRRSFGYSAPIIFNSLPSNILLCNNDSVFKKHLLSTTLQPGVGN